jgi:hypothetical protein
MLNNRTRVFAQFFAQHNVVFTTQLYQKLGSADILVCMIVSRLFGAAQTRMSALPEQNLHHILRYVLLRYVLQALLFLMFGVLSVYAQVEHVPVQHPVYQTLIRWEAQRILPPDFSSTVLPLQRKEIATALRSARRYDSLLTDADKTTLAGFEREFGVVSAATPVAQRSTVFFSATDSSQVLFSRLFSNDEKFLYVMRDSVANVQVSPLASLNVWAQQGRISPALNERETAVFLEAGGRIFGTIDSALGFFLQGTNGAALSGSNAFLTSDARLFQNATLRIFGDRFFDFTESHVRYDNRWFYAAAGRETRLWGSGYFNRALVSNNAPAMDGLMLGVRLPGVEYRFVHFAPLGQPEPNPNSWGVRTNIPQKYMAYHRLALRCAWGEFSVSEQMIYSRRNVDLTYLIPLSFLKALGSALRDRDNSLLGLDLTLRPLQGVQFKGNFVLDDINAPEIGRGFWQNKWAWNAGVMLAPALPNFHLPFDATIEYTRAEPYMFTHFDVQNATTADGQLFMGTLPPNADELTAQVRWFYGGRYPLTLTAAWRRHGRNVVDGAGNLVRNVGGDFLQTLRYDANGVPTDNVRVVFLDGDLQNRFTLSLQAGYELVRQWNVQAVYRFTALNGQTAHFVGIGLRFDDF